jgi:hypothetical protein
MKAKFEVKCEEIGFSRFHEMPLFPYSGYVMELADNLETAMKLYQMRVENHIMKTALISIVADFPDTRAGLTAKEALEKL